MKRLELASSFLALERGRERKAALGDDWLRAVAATALGSTEHRVNTDVVRRFVVIVAGRRVGERGSRVRVWDGRIGGERNGGVGGVAAATVADPAVDRVGTIDSILVSNNGKNGLVVTLLERTAFVLASCSLLGAGSARTIQVVDDAPDRVGRWVTVGLRVDIAEGAGVLNIVASEVVAPGVLGEWLERAVGVLALALIPLSHGAVDIAIGDVGIGRNNLVHGKETIDVGVVEPENGVERRVV